MNIYTSFFSNIKEIEKLGLQPIGIAVSPPRGWRKPSYKKVAPHYWMLKLNERDYKFHYDKILAELKQSDVLRELEELSNGKDIVLLCYEKKPEDCHRSMVAKWLNQVEGIEVTELGTQHTIF